MIDSSVLIDAKRRSEGAITIDHYLSTAVSQCKTSINFDQLLNPGNHDEPYEKQTL